MEKPVILTGIRSNGELTLGNYLGAILPLVNLQKRSKTKYQFNMFVPDLHSFTTPIDHQQLYQQTIKNIKMFIAGGLDIKQPNTYIYRQSFISAHSELTWILSCFTHYGELSRMIQFKDKSQTNEPVSAGLFIYPVLMAADILLYDAEYVPVGEDQRQHLELARDIAIRFNNQFNQNLFLIPKVWKEQLKFTLTNQGLRIRSLKHPEFKMSKSISDPSGTILLSDSPDSAANKILSATTDSLSNIHYDFKNQPGISNLLQINSLLSGNHIDDVVTQWTNKNSYKELKKTTSELVYDFLTTFQKKLLEVNESEIMDKIRLDEATMTIKANAKLLAVQHAVGLRG